MGVQLGSNPVKLLGILGRQQAVLLEPVDALADVTGPAVLLLGIAPQTAIPAALREAL